LEKNSNHHNFIILIGDDNKFSLQTFYQKS